MCNSFIRAATCGLAGVALLAGCGAENQSASVATTVVDSPATKITARTIAPTTTADVSPPAGASTANDDTLVDGNYDVGGHELYLRCKGTGSPTIVYLHGSITRTDVNPVSNARAIENRISETNRFCAYDRRNVGRSDTVDAVQTPEAVLSDLRSLLAVAEIEPPYVLLGASFGGLPAYLFANTYPDEVIGMVLLDAMFPDEFSLENTWPPEDRYEALDTEDENDSLERISHFDMITAAYEFIGAEPGVPMIYFASEQDGWEVGIPEYDEKILGLLAAYVDRFAPGELIWVDSPHFMEPAIPDEIADALRTVIDRAVS